MTDISRQRGFSLIEFLVGMSVLVVLLCGLAPLLFQAATVNRSQQLTAEAQANARSCVSLIANRLRSQGWDPRDSGAVPGVALGAIVGGGTDSMEVFADINEDGTINGTDEAVLIRRSGDVIEWRRSSAGAFETLARNISNDPDGDGTAEALFYPSPTANPTHITIKITARSPIPDPKSGGYVTSTVTSQVVVRNNNL